MTGGEGASSSSSSARATGPVGGFECPNCQKVFGRDDLLRRHLAREARAQAQPSLDRQKSCYECAKSKARCDLEVPACGRCKKKGKPCEYAPRSGNPNVRKARDSTVTPAPWQDPVLTAYSNLDHIKAAHRGEAYYDSDDSRASHHSSHSSSHAGHRTWSQSSGSIGETGTMPSFALSDSLPSTSASSTFPAGINPPTRTESPAPFQHPPAPPQPNAPFGKRGAAIVTQLDRSGRPFQMEDGEETPISRMVSSFTQRGMDFPMQDDTAQLRASTMEPPSNEVAKLGLMPHLARPTQKLTASHRSLPPLNTGVRLPGMGSASLRSALQVPNPLDLSGWLDEPVVPSPLYRFGPYSALKTAGPFSFSIPGMDFSPPTASVHPRLPSTAPLMSTAAPLQHAQDQAHDQIQQQRQRQQGNAQAQVTPLKSSQGAARHIWQHGINESEELPETLARAAAAHLITYPTLMVLPEATSPVPPFIFRPWLASVRSDLPASLAVARVVLAGYLVRLPSSQSTVWESIAREMRIIIGNVESAGSSDDLSIFASTAALWLYLVLAILTEEPAGSVYVDDVLVNSGLRALSKLAVSLSSRIISAEAQKAARVDGSEDFSKWGLVETMRRTLFATYTLLVLQRFREGAFEIQQDLAGCDLILGVALPASARVFESANETEWRVRCEEEQALGDRASSTKLTLRDLLLARKASESTPANLVSFFDRHDEFTNVCLSVALGLDSDAT